ncbi:MAG: hypothetical protein A2Z04_04180 [Chloroflexi bacterium RBG_16_57_9]|nr:MAG: hypothetical protein A2Z04_04180 [Chloroflexi bacterium RBG_16_57_9]
MSSPANTRFTLRRVSFTSLMRFGCLLGSLAAFTPSLICGLTGLWLVGVLRQWLESWEKFSLNVLGQTVLTVNLIDTLRLNQALSWLRTLDAWGGPGALAMVLILAAAGGLVLAVIVSLVGLGYNIVAWLTGGIEVELAQISSDK